MIVYLDDKRRQFAQIVTKIQHATAGLPLLFLGLEKVSKGEELPMAAAEIVIAILVLGTFIVELRGAIHHHKHGKALSHPKVGWFDLAAGVLLIYEAFHGAHHKPGYLRPQFLSGIVVIALGLLHARLHGTIGKRRYLQIDDDGLKHRMVFKSWSIPWAELAGVDLSHEEAVFVRKDGRRHTLDLGRLHNHDAVRRAIAEHPGSAKLLRA